MKFVETGSSLREKVATMTTRLLVMGAAHAQSSVDTSALPVACVRQSAETAFSLAVSNATTTTLMMVMDLVDAVRSALQNLDGNAHHQKVHAVHRFAMKFVETGSSLRENIATMATRTMVMGAANHARSSADTTALVTQACVRQCAETARSLTTRHATTATLLVGMDAVRTAQV